MMIIRNQLDHSRRRHRQTLVQQCACIPHLQPSLIATPRRVHGLPSTLHSINRHTPQTNNIPLHTTTRLLETGHRLQNHRLLLLIVWLTRLCGPLNLNIQTRNMHRIPRRSQKQQLHREERPHLPSATLWQVFFPRCMTWAYRKMRNRLRITNRTNLPINHILRRNRLAQKLHRLQRGR